MPITKGTILIENGTILPDSLLLNREPYSMNWTCASHLDGHGLEGQLRRIGWTLFYMAGDIKANAFGFDEEKRVNAAVSRVAKRVRAQNCNCLEITQMATKSFLGIPYVSVVAHSRHIQDSCQFRHR